MTHEDDETHEDEFRRLFQKFGIEWEQPEPTTTGSCYEVMAKQTPKVEGYAGFIVSWYFDHDGKFIEMRVWE
jgi:hypothetical protein